MTQEKEKAFTEGLSGIMQVYLEAEGALFTREAESKNWQSRMIELASKSNVEYQALLDLFEREGYMTNKLLLADVLAQLGNRTVISFLEANLDRQGEQEDSLIAALALIRLDVEVGAKKIKAWASDNGLWYPEDTIKGLVDLGNEMAKDTLRVLFFLHKDLRKLKDSFVPEGFLD